MQNADFQNGRWAVKQAVYIYYNCSYNKQIKDPSRMARFPSSTIFSKFERAFKNITSYRIVWNEYIFIFLVTKMGKCTKLQLKVIKYSDQPLISFVLIFQLIVVKCDTWRVSQKTESRSMFFATTGLQMIPVVVCDSELTSNTIDYITVDCLFYHIQTYLLCQLQKKFFSSSEMIKTPNIQPWFFFKYNKLLNLKRHFKGKRNHTVKWYSWGPKKHKTVM